MTAAPKTIDGESEMETMIGGATVPSSLTLGENNSMVSIKWVAEEGWAGSPPSTSSATRLSFAQKALLRCLHEERAADRFPLEVMCCSVIFQVPSPGRARKLSLAAFILF